MSRARGFSVVLHDVQAGSQTKAEAVAHVMAKNPVQCVVAEEPYGHQAGSHIHLFYRIENPSKFKTQLDYWLTFWRAGRVQVDIMRGTIAQACRYLMEDYHSGDEGYDPEPYFWPTRAIAVSPQEAADAWFLWWLRQPDDVWRQRNATYTAHFAEGQRIAQAMAIGAVRPWVTV